MRKGVVDVITMGCSKNLVDSEKLMRQIEACGYRLRHDPSVPSGEFVIINTCGFIGDAQQESINMILECCELKKKGRIGKLFVMGCLSGKYRTELKAEIPEIDGFYGKFDWNGILPAIKSEWHPELEEERYLTTPSHYAYLKIAEGCSRGCAYCAIPLMTGPYRSRTMESILKEAMFLAGNGVREIQLIAQDLTFYGRDLYRKPSIAELVERLSDIPGIEWIRLHYGYPDDFPMDLLRVMRERDNVCRYMDIALQHISNPVLKRMRRNITAEQTVDLIAAMRAEVPGIHIRTTLMTGFPGETDDDFEQLMKFVRDTRFERMGAFTYCEVDGTWSALHLKDDVAPEVKQERYSRLMRLQQDISYELSQEKVSKTLKTIIDRREGEYYIGRTEFDSPEVDPEVLIPVTAKRLQYGHFYNVMIESAEAFDLYGIVEQ